MGQISLTFPDSTYTSANKPSVATLKTDLSAIETGVNANQTLAVETTDTDVSANSYVLDEDAMGSDSNQKLSTQQSIKAYVDAAITATKTALFPVGSTYVNYSVSTNPGTLLGFGTWIAITEEVLVGKAGSGTFASIGSIGAETDSVAHTHTGPSHNHSYSGTTGNNSIHGAMDTGDNYVAEDSHTHNYSGTTSSDGTGNTGAMSANATTSTLQKTRVVYMWRRSA